MYIHQFGWLSERGGNFFNLLQKERGTQKGGGRGFPQKRRGSNPGGNYVFVSKDKTIVSILLFSVCVNWFTLLLLFYFKISQYIWWVVCGISIQWTQEANWRVNNSGVEKPYNISKNNQTYSLRYLSIYFNSACRKSFYTKTIKNYDSIL